MARFKILLLVFLFLTVCSYAQKFKFGEVSKAELELAEDPNFPEANAVVLHREVISKIGRYREVYERIKIFNEEGFDYAKVTIPFMDVLNIKGATYNLVNGEIEVTKLSRKEIFTEEEYEDEEIKKFTLPKVRAGSVIEIQYKSEGGTLADIYLQYGIPIQDLRVEVTNFTRRNFSLVQNPLARLDLKRFDPGSSTIYKTENVPPLVYEDYVYDMDLYRAKMRFTFTGVLKSLKFNTWEDISRELHELEEWGNQVKPKGIYKARLATLLRGEKDPVKQMELIYGFIKSEIKWDRTFGIFPDRGTRETFKTKEGDCADINMLLISMLRSLDIRAYPVLVSTKANGIPGSPGGDAFNFLIALAEVNGKRYLLDAAHDKSTFSHISRILLNWQGLVVRNDAPVQWIPLINVPMSTLSKRTSAVVDEGLLVTGSTSEKYDGYYAINLKEFLKDQGETKIQGLFNFDVEGVEISHAMRNKNEINAETETLSYEFEWETGTEEIGGKVYLSPLLHLVLTENPFISDERKFPIDFGFPKRIIYLTSITFPQGYTVEHLPEPLRIKLPNDQGTFTYAVSATDNKVQVRSQLTITAPIISPSFYYELQKFYELKIEKEAERLVLVKT